MSFSRALLSRELKNLFFQRSNFLGINGLRYTSRNYSAENKKSQTVSRLLSQRNIQLGLIGTGVGFYAVATYYTEQKKRNVKLIPLANSNEDMFDGHMLKDKPENIPTPARTIRSKADLSGLKITLYQYQTCPFCCKVRAFLDYFGFSYDVIEVNSITRKQTKWTEYKKVPFLLLEFPDGKQAYQLKDSTLIVSVLYSALLNNDFSFEEVLSSYPYTAYFDKSEKMQKQVHNKYFLMYGDTDLSKERKERIADERKWREWVDDVYVHTLSPNVYRTFSEALDAFNWFSEVGNWEKHFSTWERLLVVYLGSTVMYFIGKSLKKRHNLKDDVRQSLYDETNNWLKKVKENGTPFMGGEEPNLADLNVYGILTAIEGCDSFQDMRNNTKIKKWFNKMQEKVKNKDGSILLTQRGMIE